MTESENYEAMQERLRGVLESQERHVDSLKVLWTPSGSNKAAARQEMEADLREVSQGLESGVQKDGLREFYEKLSERIGLKWSDRFGDFLVAQALDRFDPDNTGSIQGDHLELFLEDLSLLPRPNARHPKRVTVFGGGAFGTAMATLLARKGNPVTILMMPFEEEHVKSINETHHNSMVFQEFELSPLIKATIDPEEALKDVQFIVHAIPVQFSFGYLQKLKDLIPPEIPMVSISKGISTNSLEFMNEIIPSALGRNQPTAFVCGPSFAKGVLNSDPTAVTVASETPHLARSVQTFLSTPTFRYDVVGVEVGSALKNVLAIASGLASGLGYGTNTQALLVTRGWADIRKIAIALGAKPETLTGLAGIGDLMLTCFGGDSRNNKFGKHLGKTNDVAAAKEAAGGVVEGFYTASACKNLAMKLGLHLPVLFAISNMLEGTMTPRDMIIFIMTLPLGHED